MDKFVKVISSDGRFCDIYRNGDLVFTGAIDSVAFNFNRAYPNAFISEVVEA